MKRVFSIFFAILMLAVMAVPASATASEDPGVSPRYTYIKSNSVNLTIDQSTGVATCTSTCYATSGYTVTIVCKLQRYTGTTWGTIKTWNTSADRYANISETWPVSSGFTYRVYSIFRIYNASGTLLETATSTKSCVFPSPNS